MLGGWGALESHPGRGHELEVGSEGLGPFRCLQAGLLLDGRNKKWRRRDVLHAHLFSKLETVQQDRSLWGRQSSSWKRVFKGHSLSIGNSLDQGPKNVLGRTTVNA